MLGWIILIVIILNFIVTIYCLMKVSSECDELAEKILENEEQMWRAIVPSDKENDVYSVFEAEENELK